jgi:hypothetical protein
MSVTIDETTLTGLSAYPFTYSGSDVSRGLVARAWKVKGIVSRTQLAAVYASFATWRTNRLGDTYNDGTIGSTLNFSADLPAGSVTDLKVWFDEAPSASPVGATTYLDLSFSVVDATQALAIAKREKDFDAQGKPSFGTFTWGEVTLTLTQPPDSFAALPQLNLSATGVTYLSGPLVAQKVKRIVGETTAAGWSTLRTHIETIAESGTAPAAGSWWPTSPPTATAEVRGSTTVYIVTLDLAEVI